MSRAIQTLRGRNVGAPILNIAHRGARAFAPENTIPAFAKAHALGCQMFELDVHFSKDKVLVVHHDDQLTRCTNVERQFPGRKTYYISDFNWSELQSLDAGGWFVEQLSWPLHRRQPFLQEISAGECEEYISHADREYFASGEVRIPSLQQALEFAAQKGLMVNIELKALPRMYAGLTDAVLELVQSMKMESRVLVSSFDHQQVLAVRQRSSVVATAVLSSDRLAKIGDYLELLDADAYHPGCYDDYDSLGFSSVHGTLDTSSILEARDVGRGVNVWTCNNTDQMRQLINAGVTGLISDYPNRVRDVLCPPTTTTIQLRNGT